MGRKLSVPYWRWQCPPARVLHPQPLHTSVPLTTPCIAGTGNATREPALPLEGTRLHDRLSSGMASFRCVGQLWAPKG